MTSVSVSFSLVEVKRLGRRAAAHVAHLGAMIEEDASAETKLALRERREILRKLARAEAGLPS